VNGNFAVATWVGMGGVDNGGTTVLPQAGTYHHVRCYGDPEVECYDLGPDAIAEYWYPNDAGFITLRLGVRPGDLVAFGVTMVDQTGNPSLLGQYAKVNMCNFSAPGGTACLGQNEVLLPLPQGYTYTGETAEWVFERVHANTGWGLANFGTSQPISYALAQVGNGDSSELCPFEASLKQRGGFDYIRFNMWTNQSPDCTGNLGNQLALARFAGENDHGCTINYTWYNYY
jgi:hypothetical protein